MQRVRTDWITSQGILWCLLAIILGLTAWVTGIDKPIYWYFQDWQAAHPFWGKFFIKLSFTTTAGFQQLFCAIVATVIAIKSRPDLFIRYGLFGLPLFYLGGIWLFLRMLFGVNWTKPLGLLGKPWNFIHQQVEAAPDHAKLWAYTTPLYLMIGIFVHIPKILIGRPRPALYNWHGDYWAGWIDAASRMKSMPSGHTITTFALIAILWPHYNKPWQRALMVGIGCFLCWGRVGIGAHWLGDILVGAGLGYLFSRYYAHRYELDKLKTS